MHISDYLKKNKQSFPPNGTVGVESDWMDAGELEVTKGTIWAGDPFVVNADDGCLVKKVPNGAYVLEAKAMEFAGRKRVARLRAYAKGAQDFTLGKKVGQTMTDTGLITVCDIAAVDEAVGDDYYGFNEVVSQYNYKSCGVVEFELNGPIKLPYVETAFGDCDGPVFELRSEKDRVGIELEFLPPGYVFDFDEDDEGEDQ
jgi:hypothetical protein